MPWLHALHAVDVKCWTNMGIVPHRITGSMAPDSEIAIALGPLDCHSRCLVAGSSRACTSMWVYDNSTEADSYCFLVYGDLGQRIPSDTGLVTCSSVPAVIQDVKAHLAACPAVQGYRSIHGATVLDGWSGGNTNTVYDNPSPSARTLRDFAQRCNGIRQDSSC